MEIMNYFDLQNINNINRKMIEKNQIDLSKHTESGRKILCETVFTTEEINNAFSKARKELDIK